MTRINLNTEAGVKLVEFVNTPIDGYPNSTIPASELVIGDYTGSGATMLELMFDAIPMTKAQYDDIVAFKGEATSRVAGEPHTEAESDSDKIVNLQAIALETVDRVMTLENSIEFVEFDEWSMIGTTITGKRGTRAVCRIDLGGDFDIGQVAYNDVAEDDGQRLLTITKGGVVRKFHTWTSNDMHAIQSQANNPQPGMIVSNVLKPAA
ncbi:MAG: hypothetical protein K0U41_03725 [Gammaproteobacteria bacterium]|nr:hypothetical protein [Gammaproteobacteria bacterium]